MNFYKSFRNLRPQSDVIDLVIASIYDKKYQIPTMILGTFTSVLCHHESDANVLKSSIYTNKTEKKTLIQSKEIPQQHCQSVTSHTKYSFRMLLVKINENLERTKCYIGSLQDFS